MAWIFVAGQIAFAESFPDRPTAEELNEIVRLGTECALGVNERCWATQYSNNPALYRVAPFTNNGFYLDQSLMGAMAGRIRALLPWYVDMDTAYDRTTNIAMLTEPRVWASLGIGDGISNFTLLPASDLNPATYGDYPWRIYATNLWERYKVLQTQEHTLAPVTQYWSEVWQGMGRGHTYADARAAAVADYGPRASGSFRAPIRQSTKGVFWSNFVCQVGEGKTNETTEDGDLQWVYDRRTDLTVTMSNNMIIVASAGIGPLVTTNILGTNIIVTGEPTPDVTGTYIEGAPVGSSRFWYKGGDSLEWDPSVFARISSQPVDPFWDKSSESPEGVYEPRPLSGASGTANVVYDIVGDQTNLIVSGEPTPDVTGTYIEGAPVGSSRFWYKGGDSLEWDPSVFARISSQPVDPFWDKSSESPEGVYEPRPLSGASGTATATYSNVIEVITNPASPLDYSGVYSNLGTYWWQSASAGRDTYYLYSNATLEAYVIYTNLDLNTNEAYLARLSGPIVGAYTAINFVAATEVSYPPADPNPSGSYEGNCYPKSDYERDEFQQGQWQKEGNWRIFSRDTGAGVVWYITQDTSPNDLPLPSWSKVGGGPAGEYATLNGEGIYGVASVTASIWQTCQTTSRVYRTHHWDANTVFYQCWLTKVRCEANIYAQNDGINHRAQYWAHPEKPNYGTTNLYHDQNLGLSNEVWNVLEWWAGGTWTDWTFQFPDYWWATAIAFGGVVDVPPEDIPNPSYLRGHQNESVCIGFTVTNDVFKALVDWQFRYCIGE